MNTGFVDKKELKKYGSRIVSACKRLYNRNLITALGGNISTRTSDPCLFLCSPSGMPLAEMLSDDLCLVSLKSSKDLNIEINTSSNDSINHMTSRVTEKAGNLDLSDNYSVISGNYGPTSEILIHSAVYYIRPEIKAIIHAHPPYITALSCVDEKINFNLTEDRNYYIGNIGTTPFIPGGSPKLAESVISIAQQNNAVICANHGIFVFGTSLAEAVNITELIEELAKIFFISRMAGFAGNKEIKNAISAGEIKSVISAGISEDYDSLKSSFIYRDEIFDP
jgi:ribulose-5-phosphate 4-epimerase/fuculose-1-phosphate aldolase